MSITYSLNVKGHLCMYDEKGRPFTLCGVQYIYDPKGVEGTIYPPHTQYLYWCQSQLLGQRLHGYDVNSREVPQGCDPWGVYSAVSVFNVMKWSHALQSLNGDTFSSTMIGIDTHIRTSTLPELVNVAGKCIFVDRQRRPAGDWAPSTTRITPELLQVMFTPVLKVTTPWEWAFKLGTLCSAGKAAPNWNNVHMPPFKRGCGICPIALDKYFTLGTYCKEGTPTHLLGYDDSNPSAYISVNTP